MSKLSGLLEYGSFEFKFFDDVSRSEVEIISNDSGEVVVCKSILNSSIRVNMNGKWVGDANSV